MSSHNCCCSPMNASPHKHYVTHHIFSFSQKELMIDHTTNVLPCPYMPASTLPPLPQFITRFCSHHRILNIHVLAFLVYMQRLTHNLPSHAKGSSDTHHRLFLAGVLVACKYINDIVDGAMTAKRISRWTAGLFTIADMASMEGDLMRLLEYKMHVCRKDLDVLSTQELKIE